MAVLRPLLQIAGGCAAELIAEGLVRINRQPTDKPHAKLRPGDVLTLALAHRVVVAKVLSLAPRRGPAAEARQLIRGNRLRIAELLRPCAKRRCPAYRRAHHSIPRP